MVTHNLKVSLFLFFSCENRLLRASLRPAFKRETLSYLAGFTKPQDIVWCQIL